MIHLALPTGDGFGWGVCGDRLSASLARLAPVARVDPGTAPAALPGPLLQAIRGAGLEPFVPGLCGRPHVGYTFFEDDLVAARAVAAGAAARRFDRVAAGSSWCTAVLRDAGLDAVTVLQGVDGGRFRPAPARPDDGRFVVFSGGKLELRKGQDLVLRAFKVLHDRHPDAALVAAWHNPWPATAATLAASPWIERLPAPPHPGGDQLSWVRGLVAGFGIDPARVELLPPLPQRALAEVYRRTDVGLFLNRCEGGSNLVLMEYMASGRPAVAADHTGHRDVLTAGNSLPVTRSRPLAVERDGVAVARWHESDHDEAVERLEWAYRNRDRLAEIGGRAGRDLAAFTWERAARRFLELLGDGAVAAQHLGDEGGDDDGDDGGREGEPGEPDEEVAG